MGVQALNSCCLQANSWEQGKERKGEGEGEKKESYEGARVKEQEELPFSICNSVVSISCIQVSFYHLLENNMEEREVGAVRLYLIFRRAACGSGPDHFDLHTLTKLW